MTDKDYMLLAIKEANKCLKIDDVPVGAVIVHKNKVIAKAHNQKQRKKNAIYHAEILAIKKACKKLKTWHLDDCVLYITLEPCLMCTGAIIQSRIKKIIYATSSPKFGYIESTGKIENMKNNHIPLIESGICKEISSKMLKDFFENKRG